MTQTAEQYDAAIEAGITLFMRKGFSNLSIEDIVNATGLNRYAIYSAFGTKADFLRACIRRYCATDIESLERLIAGSALTPKEIARANLYHSVEKMFELGAGCLVCENMKEMEKIAPELGDYCRQYFNKKEEVLRILFSRARDERALPAEIDPDEAAAAFMIFKFGLSNEVKRAPDVTTLKRKIDGFLAAMLP